MAGQNSGKVIIGLLAAAGAAIVGSPAFVAAVNAAIAGHPKLAFIGVLLALAGTLFHPAPVKA